MRIRYCRIPGLSSAALLALLLAANVVAADKPPKIMNVQGRVQMFDKTATSITVETKGGVKRKVIYSGDTKFMYGHSKNSKPGSSDQVKESNYISCAGTYNDKMELKATECVYREAK
jgi:hypothetical protein